MGWWTTLHYVRCLQVSRPYPCHQSEKIIFKRCEFGLRVISVAEMERVGGLCPCAPNVLQGFYTRVAGSRFGLGVVQGYRSCGKTSLLGDGCILRDWYVKHTSA